MGCPSVYVLSTAASGHGGSLVATEAAKPEGPTPPPQPSAEKCAHPRHNRCACHCFGKRNNHPVTPQANSPGVFSSGVSFLFLSSLHIQCQREPFVLCGDGSTTYPEGVLRDFKGVLGVGCRVPGDSQGAGSHENYFTLSAAHHDAVRFLPNAPASDVGARLSLPGGP